MNYLSKAKGKKHRQFFRAYRNNDAQILLLGGIAMSVAILTLAMISVSLSSISTPIDKSTFIKSEYDNIRREFGVALQDRLDGKLDYNEDLIRLYFNDTKDTFVFFIESLHGNNFNAEYIGLTYTTDDVVDGMAVALTLSNGVECITEDVEYNLR